MMMIKSLPHSPLLIDSNDFHCSKSSPRLPSMICCSLRNYDSIPKRDTFSRSSRFDRIFENPPLIQKFENELAEYCTGLEGDDYCSCWEAYLELSELEREVPKRDVENLITSSVEMKSVIRRIHGASKMYKSGKKENDGPMKAVNAVKAEEPKRVNKAVKTEERCPVPDGIPKSKEEMEEEESWRMPETAETRMLRAIGGYPSWYTPRPDHETD